MHPLDPDRCLIGGVVTGLLFSAYSIGSPLWGFFWGVIGTSILLCLAQQNRNAGAES